MSYKRWTTPMLLTMSLTAAGCDPIFKTGESGGSFCRIYEPVPVAEGSGDAIMRNETAYCVMCDPTCPDAVVEEWERRRGG